MGKDLIVVEPAIEPETFVPSVHFGVAAANDEAEHASDALDFEELEAGIASVFGSLRDDLETGANDDDLNLAEPLELSPADLLLAELNRLWAQPLAA